MDLKEIRKIFLGTDREFAELLKKFNKGNEEPNDEVVKKFHEEVVLPLKNLKLGIIVVDVQHDFISGTLAIENGPANQKALEIIPLINNLLLSDKWSAILLSQDWHPADHISFAEHARNPDRQIAETHRYSVLPFQKIRFTIPDIEQTIYPTHCVEKTKGAELHCDLRIPKNSKIIKKGMNKFVDCYSAFGGSEESTEAETILRANGVDAVMCLGLAYEICVAETTFSAIDRGFYTSLITDARACARRIWTGPMRN